MKNDIGHRIDTIEVIIAMNTEKENLIVKGIEVSYKKINEEDYICLTDIAKVKNPKHSGIVIMHWLRNQSTIKYLGLWEELVCCTICTKIRIIIIPFFYNYLFICRIYLLKMIY